VVSDYPVQGMDAVRVDDAATAAFRWWNGDDATGRAVAFLELGQALPDGARLAADVRGLPDPETGGLLENPADVARWILATYAGRAVARSAMDLFRTECWNAGLRVGGAIMDADQTIRACIDGLMRSVGAVWSGGMPGVAALYPTDRPADVPVTATFGDSDDGFSASSSAGSLATILEVRFDFNHADKTFHGAVRAEAPAAIERFGRIEAVWDAGWLRDSAAAVALASRLLAYKSRATWRYTWRTPLAIVGGSWVVVDQRRAPVRGEAFVTGTERDMVKGDTAITAECPAGPVPRVTISQISSRLEPVLPESITTDYRGGTLTITVPSVAGAPVAGAKVTLDSVQTQVSDALGRVQFFGVATGAHEILIEADGYQSMLYQVTV
jgi:hypothetical protein